MESRACFISSSDSGHLASRDGYQIWGGKPAEEKRKNAIFFPWLEDGVSVLKRSNLKIAWALSVAATSVDMIRPVYRDQFVFK